MTSRFKAGAGPGVALRKITRVGLGLLVWVVLIGAALHFGELGEYREAIHSFQLIPLLGVSALLLACNLLRVLRLKIIISEVPLLPLGRAAFIHQFLAGLFPAKLGELALPVMLARTGRVTGSEAVGVLLGARLLDLGALLAVAALTVVLAGGSHDARAPAYGFGALVILSLGAGGSLYIARTLHARPLSASRLQSLLRSIMMPLGRLTLRNFLAATSVTVIIWMLLLAAFYLGCVSFGLVAPVGEVVLSAAIGNLMAALPVNGFGGVGLSQLSWAGVLSAFGREFETALVVGVAVQAVALLVSGVGAAVMSGWYSMTNRAAGGDGC